MVAEGKRMEDAKVSQRGTLTTQGWVAHMGLLGDLLPPATRALPSLHISNLHAYAYPDGTSGNDSPNWCSGYLSGINNAVDEGNFQMS